MDYKIKEISNEEFIKYNESFYITLSALKESSTLSIKNSIELLEEINSQNGHIFVAIQEPYGIIGTAKLLIEQKFSNEGEKSGHLEDIVTRIGFRNKGVQKNLIMEIIKYSKINNCYKITLDCDSKLEEFYNKFGFKDSGNFMRKYLK